MECSISSHLKKEIKMNNRERVDALLSRKKPDRVPIFPFGAGFSLVNKNKPIVAAYNDPEMAISALQKTTDEFDWIFCPSLNYAVVGAWEFGGEIKWPDGEYSQAPTVKRYPIETPEEVMSLTLPNIPEAGMIPTQKAYYDKTAQMEADNMPWKVIFQMEGCFSFAGNISGGNKFFRWMLKLPDKAERMLRLSTDFLVESARYWKSLYGTERVMPWGGAPQSSNQVISPRHFEKLALPYIKECHEKVLDMGFKTIFKHICGEHNQNLPFWSQIPMGDPGIVSFGQEVELETAAKYFPNDIVMGNLNPTLIQTGTVEEVYQASREVIEKGKQLDTGFIFGPGCSLPPMAPAENVLAMTRAANDFGWY
jgi:uroporphyrinogen decarboxylase